MPAPPRNSRPRFQILDAVWMFLLAALALGFAFYFHGKAVLGHPRVSPAAGIVAALYLLGWRTRDRAAGVTAALLAATSLPMLTACLQSPLSATFTLLTLTALFAFVTGSLLAAGVLAGCAMVLRPDGILLGFVLLALSLAQRRRRVWIGISLFVALAAAGAARVFLSHGMPPTPVFGFYAGALRWIATPATCLLLWFLLPFCAEMGESMRRVRWLPVVLWTPLYLLSASLVSVGTPSAMLLPLMPLIFALSGCGLSRLLPNLAGEIPYPLVRYVIAILAVAGLVALHFWTH